MRSSDVREQEASLIPPAGVGPMVVGVVGDSGSGRSTLIETVRRVATTPALLHLRLDDYHTLARQERRSQGITALSPSANDLELAAAHLVALRRGVPIQKPVYQHATGTFGPLETVLPAPLTMVSGLLGYSTAALAALFDWRVFMDPDDQLWAQWKRRRDTSERGYDDDGVRQELESRRADRDAFIRPQRDLAHLVVAVVPPPGYWSTRNDAKLDVRLIAREAGVAALLEQAAAALPDWTGRPLVRLGDGEADGDLMSLAVDGETSPELVQVLGRALGVDAPLEAPPAVAVPAAVTAALAGVPSRRAR